MKNVVIVDYGMGNLKSVQRGLEKVGASVIVSSNPAIVANAERLVLPGVGAFEDGMKHLKISNLDNSIKEFSFNERPLMGICLGMQLLMSNSHENGNHDGLNLVEGEVLRFKSSDEKCFNYKIPQIGWNKLLEPQPNTWIDSILEGISFNPYMYFLHSYYVSPKDQKVILSETSYGQNTFCSVLQKNQIMGCQFHPERSGEVGLKILKNFLKL